MSTRTIGQLEVSPSPEPKVVAKRILSERLKRYWAFFKMFVIGPATIVAGGAMGTGEVATVGQSLFGLAVITAGMSVMHQAGKELKK